MDYLKLKRSSNGFFFNIPIGSLSIVCVSTQSMQKRKTKNRNFVVFVRFRVFRIPNVRSHLAMWSNCFFLFLIQYLSSIFFSRCLCCCCYFDSKTSVAFVANVKVISSDTLKFVWYSEHYFIHYLACNSWTELAQKNGVESVFLCFVLWNASTCIRVWPKWRWRKIDWKTVASNAIRFFSSFFSLRYITSSFHLIHFLFNFFRERIRSFH